MFKSGRKITEHYSPEWVLMWDKTHKTKMLSLVESIKNKEVIVTNCPRKLDIKKILNK